MKTTAFSIVTRPGLPRLRRCVSAIGLSLLLGHGLARAQQFTYHNIADENTAAPGQGMNFSDLVNTSLSGGTIAFIGSYGTRGPGNPVDYGIYTANATGTPVVARVADDTNIAQGGSQTNTAIIYNPIVSGSTVTFNVSEAANNFNGGSEIYTGTAGVQGVNLIASLNTAVPGQNGQTFTSLGNSAASGSNVVFGGSYNGGAGLYLNTAGTTGISRVVDTSSTLASGQAAGFTSVAGTTISGGNAAFTAIYNHTATDTYYNLDGVFTTAITGTGLTLRASTANAVPGQSGKNFTGFGLATLNGTHLAFGAAYSGGTGIYQETPAGTAISRVVDASTLVLGKGALTFTRFNSFSTNGTNVVFNADYGMPSGVSNSTNAVAPPPQSGEGIFLESGGNLVTILSTGDALFGSTVRDVGVDYTSYDGNNIAFSYILGNGQAGVAILNVTVPEPATWVGGALLAGLGWCAVRRRATSLAPL